VAFSFQHLLLTAEVKFLRCVDPCCHAPAWTPAPINPARLLPLSFQRLANLDSAMSGSGGTKRPSPAKP
jgi:hypothetical protein